MRSRFPVKQVIEISSYCKAEGYKGKVPLVEIMSHNLSLLVTLSTR